MPSSLRTTKHKIREKMGLPDACEGVGPRLVGRNKQVRKPLARLY